MKCYYVQNADNLQRWFFTNKAEAKKWANAVDRDDPRNDCTVGEVHWDHTKKGIVALLNDMAPNADCVA